MTRHAVLFPATLLATCAADAKTRSTCTQLALDTQKLRQIVLGRKGTAEERRHWSWPFFCCCATARACRNCYRLRPVSISSSESDAGAAATRLPLRNFVFQDIFRLHPRQIFHQNASVIFFSFNLFSGGQGLLNNQRRVCQDQMNNKNASCREALRNLRDC